MIPVDYVADAIVNLTMNPEAEGLTFHLTAPLEDLPTARELLDLVRRRVRETHGIKLKRALFIPSPVRATKGRYHAQQVITRERTGVFETLITLAPYFNESRHFHRDNVDRLLGPYKMDWRRLTETIVDHAVSMSFMHWSDRTVQEQILFRLKSKSLPVTLHDVYEGRDHPRDSREVREQMLAVAGALRSMGVGPGDRVALVGLNSTRYITIDVGIGLAGAVSVPLYYTSPPTELDQILAASGAKVLLVGIPKLLERLDELTVEIPVVSFCREDPKVAYKRDVMDWRTFLDLGKASKGPPSGPVAFSDLATVRYTSGTTGQPKGVTFHHQNLRWMATSTASLLDWETRTHHIKYLSFLPMNHVVEGILAAYAPYYTPCRLDIYFLEDFRDLQDTLGMVRPTIFFGVPRFYEKVWEALLDTNIGQNYVAMGEGLKKRLFRRLIKKGLLKKAGLIEAAQLFVGSAPIGKDLVSSYQDLGIDVLNAFGLTEAPLVTMNMQGRNRAGTVGEPLPETDVRIADDEEIMISGPQVTPGYLDPSTPSPLLDGWLMTGDLGYMTREGSLVIHGRKKELIVTSYGKNIHPVAVETLLRDVPGVDEAMVVGDGKPFCTALLWAGCEDDDPELMASIDKAIEKVNRRLSHPEQIKQWAILKNDLSIECGDLTASLKLKRREVTERHSPVLATLYGEDAPPFDGVLHVGGGERTG
jgi:long-chain acyl-CoA synthetase